MSSLTESLNSAGFLFTSIQLLSFLAHSALFFYYLFQRLRLATTTTKFTPLVTAGLVAFATAQPARDAQAARTPDTGFTVFVDEGCAGFRGNPKCKEYAEKCYEDSKNLATKQQVIDCTQAKLKADALGPGGAPSKEQFCAGYMKDPKCQEYAKACEREEFAKLRKAAESDRDWNGDAEPARQLPTGQQLIYCTQAKLVGPSLLDKLCVPFGWDNRQGCIAKITDCNTKGKVLADCMLPYDLHKPPNQE